MLALLHECIPIVSYTGQMGGGCVERGMFQNRRTSYITPRRRGMSRFLSHVAQLHSHFQIKCDSMKLLNDMKTKTKSAVESLYEFDTSQAPQSIGRNASRAQALLAKTTFIYRVHLICIIFESQLSIAI